MESHSDTSSANAQVFSSETATEKGRRRYKFRPGWLTSIIALIVFSLLLSLGYWQLHRAETKKLILAEYQQRANMQPLTLNQLQQYGSNIEYYLLTAKGYYDNAQQFLLDNRTHNHHVGYQVITPLVVPGQNKVLLVNRGWIAQGVSRQQLPKINPVTGLQNLFGTISMPSRGLILSNKVDTTSQGWPRRIQAIDFNQISQALGKPVYPFVLQLSPQAKNGFVREWQPVTVKPQKHTGYAVQWFALALVLLIIYIVVNIEKIKKV